MKHLAVYPDYGRRAENAKGVARVLLRLLPFHTLSPLYYELRMAYVRLKYRNGCIAGMPHAEKTGLLVNIGAGSSGRKGWVNIDGFKLRNVNCVFDARKKLPFADGSVRGIFSEHFFEHLDYTEEVPYFLTECERVLAENGVLRIIVPDAERYLSAYLEGGWEELSKMRPIDSDGRDFWLGCTYNTRMELVNVVFRQGSGHKFAYDYETLEFVLTRFGFRMVERQSFGESVMPELCIDQEMRVLESLCVEGIK